MKHLYLLFFLLFSVGATAQNYRCLQPDSIHYFTSQSHILKGMRIDSVKVVNNETYFYPFHTPRGEWNTMLPQLDTNGGSWLGKEIIERQDGVTLFDNLWGDTIFIHTQATLNDSWRFYEDTSQNYYEATVTSIDTLTIKGTLDSVKIITLSAYNASGINTSDSIHGKQIILSKNHGLYQTFALYTFPFPILQRLDYIMDRADVPYGIVQVFNQVEVANPTKNQLYNYSTGTVYHYYGHHNNHPSGFVTYYAEYDSIISSTNDGNQEITIIFSKTAVTYSYINYTIPDKTDTLYTANNAIVNWFDKFLMPEEKGNPYFLKYIPNDSTCNVLSARYTQEDNSINGSGELNNFEPCGPTHKWKVGFGEMEYSYCLLLSPASAERRQVYYNSSAIICGKPMGVLNINEQHIKPQLITLYPNPAKQTLYIPHIKNHPYTISDIAGKILLKGNVSHDETVDVRKLEPGLYFIKIGYASGKFLKE